MKINKLLDENNPENTVVHVVFVSPKDPRREQYECVGVLTREEKDMIRVVFNAKNDVADEFIVIQKADIVSIHVVDPLKIERLQ